MLQTSKQNTEKKKKAGTLPELCEKTSLAPTGKFGTCGGTHQSLVLERVVDATQQEPKWPQVLEAELHNEVSHQHQPPNDQKLDVQKRTAKAHKWNA